MRLGGFIRVVALCALVNAGVHAEPVAVDQGKERGSGFSFRKGDACFVVTAQHVAPCNDPITITDIRNESAIASTVYRGSKKEYCKTDAPKEDEEDEEVDPNDVAVLRVKDGANIACSSTWNEGEDDSVSFGTSHLFRMDRVTKNGRQTVKRLKAASAGPQIHTLKPAADDEVFEPGDSGSFVFDADAGNVPIGMIVAVKGREIYALRIRWVDGMVRTFVAKAAPARDAVTMTAPARDVNLFGADFRFSFPDTVEACSDLCRDDDRCRSYTFVNANIQGATAFCWLKDSVPQASRQPGTFSGVKNGRNLEPVKVPPDILEGQWRNTAFPDHIMTFERGGDEIRLAAVGSVQGDPFSLNGTATIAGRTVKFSYAAKFASGNKGNGACAGVILEGPSRELHLSVRCNDTATGNFPIDAVKLQSTK